MKERPIIFNGDMVRAILDGRKTQTRRVMKPQPSYDFGWYPGCGDDGKSKRYCNEDDFKKCVTLEFPKYGVPRDKIWVRENTEADEQTSDVAVLSRYCADKEPVIHRGCKDPEYDGSIAHWDYFRKTRPSIHMPRWASRITLEIENVRVERLQDISEEDAVAEGLEPLRAPVFKAWKNYLHSDQICFSPKESFESLWQSINGADGWDKNPWVWVIDFSWIKQPLNMSIKRGYKNG